jgi:hypothetical protein
MNLAHLKKLLNKHGLKQTDLAHLLGRDKAVITNLFQGKRQLKADEAAIIAEHLGTTVADVMGIQEKGKQKGFGESPVLIPFQQDPEKVKKHPNVVRKGGKFYLEVAEIMAHSKETYAVEVRDDGMNMSGIFAGDIIISDLSRMCRVGQIVVGQHYQGRGAKTVIRKYEPPYLLPHSSGTNFKPLSLDFGEARAVSPVLKLIRVF